MPHKRHTVSLNNAAFKAFVKVRGERPSSAAMIAMTDQLAAKQSSVVLPLHDASMQEPRSDWFTTEQANIAGCDVLRGKTLTAEQLIATSAEVEGVSVETYTRNAVIEAARRNWVDRHRAKGGATNAKGASDDKIVETYHAMLKAGLAPNVSRLRSRTGSNYAAVKRVFDRLESERKAGQPETKQSTT